MNVNEEVNTPTLQNFEEFFTPTDQQITKLTNSNNTKLETNILQKTLLIDQASQLIENKDLKSYLKSISMDLKHIEIYKQSTLFEFSTGYYNYSEKLKSILKLTQHL